MHRRLAEEENEARLIDDKEQLAALATVSSMLKEDEELQYNAYEIYKLWRDVLNADEMPAFEGLTYHFMFQVEILRHFTQALRSLPDQGNR